MTLNILSLQPFTSASFSAANNADWRDAIAFLQSNEIDPLDITGIKFYAQLRKAAGQVNVYLDMSTENSLIVNGGATGVLQWNVFAERMRQVTVGDYVMDIIAIQDIYTINLFPSSPAVVEIIQGITIL